MIFCNYIIENYLAYEAVSQSETHGKAVWHTTSPYLLAKLPLKGEKVYSLERRLDRVEVDELAKTGYLFSDKLSCWLNEVCSWRDYADLRMVFSAALRHCFFVTFYKGFVLQKLLDQLKREGNDPLVCVGNSDGIIPEGIALSYGRLDTLYAFLAALFDQEGLSVIHHQLPAEKIKGVDKSVSHRKMSSGEKLLSFINNTPASFFYKTIKRLKGMGRFPFQHVGVLPWAKKHFYIYRDCELLEESFWGLLWRGGRIGWLETLPVVSSAYKSYEDLPDASEISRKITILATESLTDKGLMFLPIYETTIKVIVQRALTVLERLRVNMAQLTEGFHSVISKTRSGSTVLTNGFSTPMERLFYCYCRKVGVRVAAFEHGITMGLSQESTWHARHSGMLSADIGFYHNQEAVDAIAPYAQDQEKIVAGMPHVTRRLTLPRVQRFLARKWLGIENNRHVVMYVANLERNNHIYGPYNENDYQFSEVTRKIFQLIQRGFPGSLCVLKLYPSQRYLECYDFTNDIECPHNSLIIRDIDFRFIRGAADLIFLTSPQSTMGWVIGSGKPTIFAELGWIPVTFQGFEMGLNGVPEVHRWLFLPPNHPVMEKRNLKAVFRKLFQHEAMEPKTALVGIP